MPNDDLSQGIGGPLATSRRHAGEALRRRTLIARVGSTTRFFRQVLRLPAPDRTVLEALSSGARTAPSRLLDRQSFAPGPDSRWVYGSNGSVVVAEGVSVRTRRAAADGLPDASAAATQERTAGRNRSTGAAMATPFRTDRVRAATPPELPGGVTNVYGTMHIRCLFIDLKHVIISHLPGIQRLAHRRASGSASG